MKNRISYFLVLLLTLAACEKENASTASDSLIGKWKLVKYHHLANGTNESEPSNISRSIVMEFIDNGVNGTMNGVTVINSVQGEYEILEAGKMRTVSFGGSKIGEPDWGNKFWDAIHAASSFKRQENRLFIYFNSDSEKMEFENQ